MVLVIIAMILVPPTLHTQTPVSTSPPSNGGTGNGGGADTGTGPGTGNGTGGSTGAGTSPTPSCNATGDDHAGDGQNESDVIGMAVHTLDDGNRTNGTAGHDGACDGLSVDHDRQGDRMSNNHHGHEADDLAGNLAQAAMTLGPILTGWVSTAAQGLVAFGGLFFEPLAGLVSSGLALAPSR